jgi:endonuclease/exonuclease/phosphatase family metal-dependent hydrolase
VSERPAGDVRVVTYNTAAGNPKITTPQAAFLDLPFYREALGDEPGAPILALQEVGTAQARALRRHRRAKARILQLRRPGLGDALVIPARYEVLETGRGYYGWSQVMGILDALARWARTRTTPNWRQFGELRMWLSARLREPASGREFTIFATHLSVEPSLKVAQARALVRRIDAAAERGPVVLAGDLNVPAGHAHGLDVEVAAMLAHLRDMGTVVPPGRPNIDYVLAAGFEPVSSRIWTGDSLQLPGSPDAAHVSDHYPEDDVLRLAPAGA